MGARVWFGVGLACGLVVVVPVAPLTSAIETGQVAVRAQVPPKRDDIAMKARIFSVFLERHRALGGTLRAGDHVDVIATLKDAELGQPYTKLLIQNVIVREVVDVEASQRVDLLVIPEEVEALMLAQETGKISFALRNPDDVDIVGTGRTTLSSIARELTRESKPQRCRGVVEIIRE